MITKSAIKTRTVLYLLIGHGILLFLIIGNEVFDIPHHIFGTMATPINWSESLLEGIYVVGLAAINVYLILHYVKRIRFLEGLLPICAICKKIREGKEWSSLEEYMTGHSEALFSHGLCPDCAEKYYGECAQQNEDRPQYRAQRHPLPDNDQQSSS